MGGRTENKQNQVCLGRKAWSVGVVQLGKRRLWGDLAAAFQYLGGV